MDELNLAGYTRITEVLNYFIEPELADWMIRKGKDHRKIGQQAMKIGTEVDEAIKKFVVTGKYPKVKSKESASCLEGFKQWFEDYKPTLEIGVRLYNTTLSLTGEPDLYWNHRILDVKCASAIRPKYHIQTGGYTWIDKKQGATGIIRLHKHLGDYEYVERNAEEVVRDRECFQALYTAYNHLKSFRLGTGRQNGNYTADKTF